MGRAGDRTLGADLLDEVLFALRAARLLAKESGSTQDEVLFFGGAHTVLARELTSCCLALSWKLAEIVPVGVGRRHLKRFVDRYLTEIGFKDSGLGQGITIGLLAEPRQLRSGAGYKSPG
jgi:hypothetical protein